MIWNRAKRDQVPDRRRLTTSPDGWAWATAEGTATLTGPGIDPDGPEVQALVDYYRAAAGEHPDWDEYRKGRVELVLTARVASASLSAQHPALHPTPTGATCARRPAATGR